MSKRNEKLNEGKKDDRMIQLNQSKVGSLQEFHTDHIGLQKELDVCVGFDGQKNPLTLRNYVNKNMEPPFFDLSPEEQKEIIIERVNTRPDWDLYTISAGYISRERSVQEINSNTGLGQAIFEIEVNTLKKATELVRKERSEKTTSKKQIT